MALDPADGQVLYNKPSALRAIVKDLYPMNARNPVPTNLKFLPQQIYARMKTLTIGRNETCDIVIRHPEVSRLHARLLSENGEWWIVDEQSTHGTFVDGRRIARERITPASKVMLGPYLLNVADLIKPQPASVQHAPPRQASAQHAVVSAPEVDYLTPMKSAYVVYKKSRDRFELQAQVLKGGVMLIPLLGPAINYILTSQVKKRVLKTSFFKEFKTKVRCPHCDYGIYQIADRQDTAWEEFVNKGACPNCKKSLAPKNN